MGAGKEHQKRKNAWTASPFLNFRVSESLDFLASLLGTLLMAGIAIQVCSGFQTKKWVSASPRSYSKERGKHWQQLGALDQVMVKPLPLPAPCSLPVRFMGSRGGYRGRILCRWGWGWEKTTEPIFPSWYDIYCGLPTLQTHFFTLVNNNPFIQPVWNHQSLIIDLRPWIQSWKGVGIWGMGGGRGGTYKKQGRCR